MNTNYLDVLQEDGELYKVVKDKLPDLHSMSPDQIERLVFYLKNLHTYYPNSENHTHFWEQFEAKLKGLRNSPEQIALQHQASWCMAKAIVSCILAGMLLSGALIAAISGHFGMAIGVTLVCGALVLIADSRMLRKAILLSKEQDRRYFLSSLREAKGCNELDWAGLFAYNNGETDQLTASLRSALYNDEFFGYSSIDRDVDSKSK